MKLTIKLLVLAAAVALVWTVEASQAAADTVRTTRRVKMMKRPGERSRVVKRVPSGKSLKVLKRSGRWIQVRYGSQSGWVTRTSVRSEDSERSARKTARRSRKRAFVNGRSKRRGWSDSAPEDRIGADATDDEDFEDEEEDRPRRKRRAAKAVDLEEEDDWGEEEEDVDEPAEEAVEDMVVVSADEAEVYRKPSTRSKSVFVAEQGDKLYFVSKSKSGKWIEVEDQDGETGWVKASAVEQAGPYKYAKTAYRANGGLGYTAVGMQFVSDGAGPLANYSMSSAAASLVVGGEMIYAGGSKTRLLGADLTYRGSRASPGIRYDDGAGNVADIAFIMHEVDVGASYGHRFARKDGLAAYARAGYYYGQFKVTDGADIENVNIARIPSELLTGFTVGGRVDAPRLTDTIGANLTASYLLSGKREQTVGLEDGQTSAVTSYWATAQVVYQWKPDMKLVGAYRYFGSKTDWAGAADGSMRGHNATAAARKDVVHTVSVGVGKVF